jgi:hypothetical protein
MSCCGEKRAAVVASMGTAPQLKREADGLHVPNDERQIEFAVVPETQSQQDVVSFELLGDASLVIVGGVTGERYHFSEHGRRVFVDARDRLHVALIAGVREIKG